MHIDPLLPSLIKELAALGYPFLGFCIFAWFISDSRADNLLARLRSVNGPGGISATLDEEKKAIAQKELVLKIEAGKDLNETSPDLDTKADTTPAVPETEPPVSKLDLRPAYIPTTVIETKPAFETPRAINLDAKRRDFYENMQEVLTVEQERILKQLNAGSMPTEVIRIWIKQMRDIRFGFKTDLTSRTWLKNLEKFGLTSEIAGHTMITDLGRDYLRFLVDEGYSLDS